MPGRLRAIARLSPSSSTENVHRSKQQKQHAAQIFDNPLIPSYIDTMHHLKRQSLTGRKSSDKKATKAEPSKPPVEVGFAIESPPLVFYNGAQNSTGALFSGQLKVHVNVTKTAFQSIQAKLFCAVTHKKPVSPHCPDCTTQTNQLHEWDILQSPKDLDQGEYSYPVSYLFEGHLPVTTHGTIVKLDYYLSAEAHTANGDVFTYKKTLDVKRAIFPQSDRASTRLFPPTDIVANASMNHIIHPIGSFNVQLRLSGMNQRQTNGMQVRWRLRKIIWRIEEYQKMIAPACPKHASKVGGEGKGLLYDHTRAIAVDDIKEGWKTDYSEGTVELEFSATVDPALHPICDVEAPNGLEVHHHLVVEMIVAEEWAPINKPESATPTGAARVLRTRFRLLMTERTGLGISWDEEQPPVYEDVPASPPNYASTQEVSVTELEEADRLSLGS